MDVDISDRFEKQQQHNAVCNGGTTVNGKADDESEVNNKSHVEKNGVMKTVKPVTNGESNGDSNGDSINGDSNIDSMDVDENSVDEESLRDRESREVSEVRDDQGDEDNDEIQNETNDDTPNETKDDTMSESVSQAPSELASEPPSEPQSEQASEQGDESSNEATKLNETENKDKENVANEEDSKLEEKMKNKYAYLQKGMSDQEELRPVAELLFNVGLNLAKQQVYEDLTRVHDKKKQKDALSNHGKKFSDLYKSKYETFVEANKPFALEVKKCKDCAFKTESDNVLQWHLEFAHGQDNNTYECSFCEFIGKQPGEFFFHMEAEHNRKGRIYMKHAFFSCALCPFENNSKKALMKHQQKCERSFKMRRNLEPAPTDCDIPLKLVRPRMPPVKPMPKVQAPPPPTVRNMIQSRQQMAYNDMNKLRAQQQQHQQQQQQQSSQNSLIHMMPRQQAMQQRNMAGQQQHQSPSASKNPVGRPRTKPVTPSIPTGAASRFEICEICGGFVKDRESLRVHFYWAHRVDIQKNVFDHKQPHLMCEFCPQRFWTYQGLARHRQISHNKQQQTQTPNRNSKPQHNCILCGAQNVTHLLNHLSNAHNITLQTMFKQKRCLCCGASFNEEKMLERHMLNSHSDLFRIKPHAKKSPNKMGPSSPKEKKAVSCPLCKSRFQTHAAFDAHFASSHSNMKCHRCPETFTSQEAVLIHWHDVHAKETEECQLCDEVMKIGRPYLRHIRCKHLQEFSINIERMDTALVDYLITRKRPLSFFFFGPSSKRQKMEKEAARRRAKLRQNETNRIKKVEEMREAQRIAEEQEAENKKEESRKEEDNGMKEVTEEIVDKEDEIQAEPMCTD